MKRVLLLPIALLGCPSADDNSDTAAMETTTTVSTTVSTTTSTDGGSSSNATVDTTSDSTAPAESSSDTGPMCGINEDCGDTEVCYDGQCVGATNVEYLAEVMYWMPADCGTLNSPDLYYALQYDGEIVITSGVAPDCPGVWTSFCMPAPVISEVIWFLLDDDFGSPSDSIDRLCWPEPTNPEATCLGFSEEVLHEGMYDGPTLNGHITVTFRPGC